MLVARITKNSVRFRVRANVATAAANPQYQDSAWNPSRHLA